MYTDGDIKSNKEFIERLVEQRKAELWSSHCHKAKEGCNGYPNSHRHLRCPICNWVICPEDGACSPGCTHKKQFISIETYNKLLKEVDAVCQNKTLNVI